MLQRTVSVVEPKNKLVRKAFIMLRAFHGAEEGLTSQELSQRAHLPKASGHRLIQTLEDIGAVMRGPDGRYRLGMTLVSLSHDVAVDDLLRETAQMALKEVSERLDLTIHMGLLQDGMVTYIAQVSDSSNFSVGNCMKARHEAYCSALGKVLLAALSPEALESFLQTGAFVAMTPRTITDPVLLRAEIEKVRSDGYALEDEEALAGVRSIAVPICDSDGRTVAAISATDDAACMDDAQLQEAREALMGAALTIGRKIFRGIALLPV
ncbi:MAG TPA: IclR family transcriptional regulator [Rhizomicrobium sp.]|nr:IclR family transcriptional regulator [Rhizomicrobium sp.]